MPTDDHFTALIDSDMKSNNTLDYYYYDNWKRGGIVLNFNDSRINILNKYNIYLVIYQKIIYLLWLYIFIKN